MLFRKRIDKCCAYCTYATKLDDDQVLCSKRGVKEATQKCLKFRYDPYKRVPARPKSPDFDKYSEEDFKL